MLFDQYIFNCRSNNLLVCVCVGGGWCPLTSDPEVKGDEKHWCIRRPQSIAERNDVKHSDFFVCNSLFFVLEENEYHVALLTFADLEDVPLLISFKEIDLCLMYLKRKKGQKKKCVMRWMGQGLYELCLYQACTKVYHAMKSGVKVEQSRHRALYRIFLTRYVGAFWDKLFRRCC